MKKVTVSLILIALVSTLLTGCDFQHQEYDGSGFYTAKDQSFQVTYQENFLQRTDTGDNYISLDWESESINIQYGHFAKNLDAITTNNVTNLDEFIKLYEVETLDFLFKYSTFTDLEKDDSFTAFSDCRIYYQTTTKGSKTVKSFIVYGETQDSYFAIYGNGDEKSYDRHQQLLYDMAHNLFFID